MSKGNIDFAIKAANATTTMVGMYAEIIRQLVEETKDAMQQQQVEHDSELRQLREHCAVLERDHTEVRVDYQEKYNRSQLKVVELVNQLATIRQTSGNDAINRELNKEREGA